MIKPLNDYILLSYAKEKDKEDGIILSDISKDKKSTAIVAGVGDQVEKIKVNDVVIFNPFIVREIKIDGKKFYVVREKDVYAIYE